VGAAALVLTGLYQTWSGMQSLGSLSQPVSFVMPAGHGTLESAAQVLLGLMATAAGLSASAGRRWGLVAGIAIASVGGGLALAGTVVGS
jgi:hypothetical protein